MDFRAAFKKVLGVFFQAARMVGFVEDSILADILTGKSPKTLQQFIQAETFFLHCPISFNISEDADE